MFDTALPSLGDIDWTANGAVIVVTAALLALLFAPAVRRSTNWRATVTPLASIIGSGFLVITPLLAFMVGIWAVFAMLALVLLAWFVGSAVRYNIARLNNHHPSAELESDDEPGRTEGRSILWMERASRLWLAIAYVIAVTFYIELLGAFVMRGFNIQHDIWQKGLATALLLFIGGFGLWRGLRVLEGFEKVAVDAKLAIIGGLLAGLAVFNVAQLSAGTWSLPNVSPDFSLGTLRELLGAFLVIQGFETSRYLGTAYDPETRIRTMRYAQIISAAIYLLFVALSTVLFDQFRTVSETSIIDLSHGVAHTLPWLLIVGAAMSQFGAAVADTIGAGGLVEEATHGHIKANISYVVLAVCAVVLIWVADIFQVIAYASRAFALFYALQCGVSTMLAWRHETGPRKHALSTGFATLTLVMLAIAAFGVPAETHGS